PAEQAVNTVATEKGSKSMVVLPDNSKVWINADTRLFYNESYGKTQREITLEGEAYFDVVKNKSIPFIVHSRNMDIKVTGTSFNVRAYADEQSSEATLVRGAVEVQVLKKGQGKVLLRPGEKIIVRNTDYKKFTDTDIAEVQVVKVNAVNKDSTVWETQWVQNRLAFENESLRSIIPVLERWYNVTIVFKRELTLKNTFS